MTCENKIVIVTGAASGMGLATTRLLRDQGATVYAVDRQEVALQAGCAACGAIPSVVDITSSRACDELVARVVEEQGRLDGIANFAGVLKRTGILDCSDEEFDFVMETNVKGCFYL